MTKLKSRPLVLFIPNATLQFHFDLIAFIEKHDRETTELSCGMLHHPHLAKVLTLSLSDAPHSELFHIDIPPDKEVLLIVASVDQLWQSKELSLSDQESSDIRE